MTPGQDIFGTAGESIRGLAFKIYDEAGQEKDVDETLAKKIKVRILFFKLIYLFQSRHNIVLTDLTNPKFFSHACLR